MTNEEIENKLLGSIRGLNAGNLEHTKLIALAKAYLINILSIYDIDISQNTKDQILESVIERYEMLIGVIQPAPVILDNGDPDDWFIRNKGEFNFEYSERYYRFLQCNDFPDDTIKTIKSSTEKVLSYCANPKGSVHLFARKKRGLVVGDVQSGKTSNYLSLINMACDVGYKIIVLLAGMTSSLRQQTQDRIDEGFIGARSDSISSVPEYIGVGIESQSYYGIPLTNHTNDFVKFVKQNQNASSQDYNKPIVLVVKKNKSVLECVSEWLKPGINNIERNTNILIIDDEADNASVNTKKDPAEMSAINKAIRTIYNNFDIASYVGYTATPFANIFINPFEEDPSNQDLFPSDFIVLLETPNNYFGFDKTFEKNDNNKYKHVHRIDQDAINYLPTNHKKDVEYDCISIDLKEAILNFYLCNVLRTLDGKIKKHRSMLINISRFNDVQHKILEAVSEFHEKFKDELLELNMKEDSHFLKSKNMKMLHDLYYSNECYSNYQNKYSWRDIRNVLLDEVKKVEVKLINNSVKNRFSYEDYKDVGARVIIIGGYVLSRGLTLEGLTISYFDRNSVAYDTLLQMCRWFGYRFGYEEICQVYMTQEAIDSFEAVNDAVCNLKEQFKQLSDSHKSPKDFGLMVKESPDTLDTALLVTSRNKMYNTEQVLCTLNYSGFAVDTSKIYRDKEINDYNHNCIKNLFKELHYNGICIEKIGKRLFSKNVDRNIIAEFIKKIKIPFENVKFDQDSIYSYILDNKNKNVQWDVVVASGACTNEFNICDNLSIYPVIRKYDPSGSESIFRVSGNKNRLFEPSIFSAGLSDDEISSVKKYAKNEVFEGRRKSNTPIVLDYLNVKNRNPLLVIYPVVLYSQNDEYENNSNFTVYFGFALGFPSSEKGIRVKYRANKIKIEQLLNRYVEEEEYEEDYD